MYQAYFDKFLNMVPYLEIDETEWNYIKNTFSVEDIKESMATVAMTYPIPYNEISELDAYHSYMDLKKVRWNELLVDGEWFYRSFNTDYALLNKYFSRTNRGSHSSNYFQQENRWEANSIRSPGPSKTWRTKSTMVSLMGSLFTLKVPYINKSVLRGCLHLRKYTCSQFRPSVAKALYDMYESKNVLDFSMGWGDRLAAFYAGNTTEHYVGIDPKIDNHPIYDAQRDFYIKHTSFFENEKTSEFHAIPAEDFDFSNYKNYFDMVFTSPPYFNVEHYSQDDTQSFKRHKSVEDWNDKFLHKVLTNIYPSVKLNGIVAINISDIFSTSGKGKKRWLEITTPMNNHLKSLGMEYIGAIGMEMAKRPNSGGAGTVFEGSAPNDWTDDTIDRVKISTEKTFCEPIFLWKKI